MMIQHRSPPAGGSGHFDFRVDLVFVIDPPTRHQHKGSKLSALNISFPTAQLREHRLLLAHRGKAVYTGRIGGLAAREPDRNNQHRKPAQHVTFDTINAHRARGTTVPRLVTSIKRERRKGTCRWIAEHRGLLVTGPCGIGKSWLSCALAQKACRDGYTVHYARVPRLFADLDLAHGDGRFARLFRMLVRVDLLVLDDWGPDRLSASQRRDLMEIVEDHRRVDGGLAMTTAARKSIRCHAFALILPQFFLLGGRWFAVVWCRYRGES
jgi:hypothetical protein